MSGGGGDSQTTQTTEPYAGQKPYLEDLFREGQRFYQQGVPDVSGATNAAYDAVAAYRGALPNVQNIAAGAAGQQQFLAGDVLSPGANPALQQYIDLANQATTRAYQQNIAPGLQAGAVQAGNVGSSRAGIAEGLARQGLGQQIGQQTAGITSAAYGQGLDAYTRGLALAPQTAQLQGAAGGVQQQVSSLLAGIETLPQEQQLQLLQAYQSLIGGQQFGGTTTTTGPGTETGGLSGALGGASAGYTLGKGTPAAPWLAAGGAIAGYLS